MSLKNITDVKLLKTVYVEKDLDTYQYPDFPFVGRSNVGKSSLTNYITNKKLAHVSKKPGKTQSINHFLLNDKVMLTDLPGYGFASITGSQRKKWDKLMAAYFSSDNIKCLFWLLDCRNFLNSSDRQMLDFVEGVPYDVAIILTKVDKISKTELLKARATIKKEVSIPDEMILNTSSSKKIGKDQILKLISSYM